jgi:hypothetical protein
MNRLIKCGETGIYFQSSTCGYPVFPAAFVEEDVFSPSCVLGSFFKDQLAVDIWVYVWVF